MKPPSTASKVRTVVRAVGLAAVLLVFGAQAVIMTGTKANTSFVQVSGPAPPAGATTTTTARSGTTAPTIPNAAPAAQP